MQTTFITIHDLSDEALILYSSDSIIDILGHYPDEVVNRSTWDFFDPTVLRAAQKMHKRSITLDKASVLAYCDIRNREGIMVRCECCFSVVYNVLVACVSVYNQGMPGQRRRVDAPIMRRLFSSSPKDPRYHMLQHLSARFRQDASLDYNEPRAALFLNRFTRSLAVMYATNGIEEITGLSSDEMRGRSFYYCIAEVCLQNAVNCLESAKANDSLAYLRFIFRDPRQDDEPPESSDGSHDADEWADVRDANMTDAGDVGNREERMSLSSHSDQSPGLSLDQSTTSVRNPADFETPTIELEAIISCTSDGLVVCLRKARTPLPDAIQNTGALSNAKAQSYSGQFAAPWADSPLYYPSTPRDHDMKDYPGMPVFYDETMSAAEIRPEQDKQALLRAIQECGVLAWGLVGINDSLADLAHGHPAGNAIPAQGAAMWAPSAISSPQPIHR